LSADQAIRLRQDHGVPSIRKFCVAWGRRHRDVGVPNRLDCGMPGAVTGVSIDVAPTPPSVPLCVGTLIRKAGMNRSRRKHERVAGSGWLARCSIARRPC
jgi:hypothetical protein